MSSCLHQALSPCSPLVSLCTSPEGIADFQLTPASRSCCETIGKVELQYREDIALAACPGVFDGHRGPEAADFVAQHFPRFLRAQWTQAEDPGQALRRAFVSLDEAFRQQQARLCASASA